MRKNTPPPAPPPNDDDRDLANDPDLLSIIERLPDARRVSVQRMNEQSERWAQVRSFTIDAFSIDNVQRKCGGGLYQFQFHGPDGRVLRKVTSIEIEDLPEDEREPARNVAPAQTVPAGGISEIQLIREQMANDRAMMMELIRSLRTPQAQPQSDITAIVSALATLHGMQPKHENPPDVQVLLMKSFEKGLETAAKIHTIGNPGSASPVGEVLTFVRDVFKEAQPLIVDLLKPKPAAKPAAPGVGPAIAASADEIPEDTDLDLTPAVIFIKDRLNDGIPPAALAKMVLQQMEGNPETKATITAIVMEQPIEEIVALDPELAAEPLRTQFGEFFGVLRARISADAPTS